MSKKPPDDERRLRTDSAGRLTSPAPKRPVKVPTVAELRATAENIYDLDSRTHLDSSIKLSPVEKEHMCRAIVQIDRRDTLEKLLREADLYVTGMFLGSLRRQANQVRTDAEHDARADKQAALEGALKVRVDAVKGAIEARTRGKPAEAAYLAALDEDVRSWVLSIFASANPWGPK